MDHTRARQVGDRGITKQQSVEQGATPITCARMHHQSSGFIDNDDGVVLMQHVKRNLFRQKCELIFARNQGSDDFLTTEQLGFWLS